MKPSKNIDKKMSQFWKKFIEIILDLKNFQNKIFLQKYFIINLLLEKTKKQEISIIKYKIVIYKN